jgi:hypothetical protein
VQEKFANRDDSGDQQRARQQHQIDQRRERDVNAGMDDAARVAVLPLFKY